MQLRTGLIAGLSLATLVACGQKSDTPAKPASAVSEATYSALFDDGFTQAGASEADLGDLTSALPDFMTLSWDAKQFDAASGATVFEGLALSIGSEHPFGVKFDQARVWGLETDLLTARLNGQRLDEAGPLFSRFDGSKLTYFGVSVAINNLLDALISSLDEDEIEAFDLGFDSFDMTVDRVVIKDAALRPWELVRLPQSVVESWGDEFDDEESDDKEFDENALAAIHFGQQLIAITRSVAYGEGAAQGMQGTFAMRQPGIQQSFEASWDTYYFSGIAGFDVDRLEVMNGRSVQRSTFTDTGSGDGAVVAGFLEGMQWDQGETYARSNVSGLKLDKVMGYLARSELPGADVRDLLSLGTWTVDGYAAAFNDAQAVTIDRMTFSADKFAWVLPESITLEVDNASIHVEDMAGTGRTMAQGVMSSFRNDIEESEDLATYDTFMEGLDKAIALLPEHGLSTISFDINTAWKWDADSGATGYDLAVLADGFGDSLVDFQLDLPAYSDVQTIMAAEDKEAASETAFENSFAFRGFRFLERDKGGYDKLLGFAHAIGQEYPNEGWGAMLGSMEPPQMRAYMATIIRIGKAEAARELPAAADWLEAYASYLESGGTFEFKVAPPQPIDKAFVEAHDDAEGEEIADFLGISATHTK